MCADLAAEPLVIARDVGKWFPSTLTRGRLLRHLWPTPMRPRPDDFWALRGVSFTLERGRVLGLIGSNGSGKSTLLQIVAGLMAPSEGSIRVNGPVTPLLELGAGFNPDFTGRENILLSGEVYGHSTNYLSSRLDDICDFAGIGSYIDQPVKTYSSGMFARLAFAVAIETQPELLIIDEILSVGDVGFQARCYRRIEMMRENGASILFVSHDLNAVQSLCDEVLLLNRGQPAFQGEPRAATDHYLRLTAQQQQQRRNPSVAGPAQPDIPLRLHEVRLVDAEGRDVQTLRVGERYALTYEAEFFRAVEEPIYTMQLLTVMGLVLYDQNTLFAGKPFRPAATGDRVRVRFDFKLNVCPGAFRLGVGVAEMAGDVPRPLAGTTDLLAFEAVSDRRAFGVTNLEADVNVSCV